jgi:hypothetical protein
VAAVAVHVIGRGRGRVNSTLRAGALLTLFDGTVAAAE